MLSSPLLHAHGEYHSVVRKLTTQIKAEPQNTKHRYLLAAAHVEHDEWELTLAECDRIEKIAPGKHQLGYFRGRALATAGRWQEALAPLDAILTADPSHQQARIWRARVHLGLEDFTKSAADFRKTLETSRNPEYHTEFAKVLMKQNHPQQAVTALQHGLTLNPDDPAILECLVECATTANDTPAALSAVERLIQTWPRPELWMLRRAKLLAATDRNDEALAAWNALALHLKKLPNLDRAQPFLIEIQAETNAALGIKAPSPVVAPPAPAVSR